MRIWFIVLMIWSSACFAQDEVTEETPFEGVVYNEMEEADVEALMVSFERRILIPPMMSEPGASFVFGLSYKSLPANTESEIASGIAGTFPLIPSPSLGVEWASERQKVYVHGFYMPFINLDASPIDIGFYWTAFGQDLLLAQTDKAGRGLIFSYRFSYSSFTMERQFTVEDDVNKAFWDSSSIASEVTLGWRTSDWDITYWLAGGSVNNSAEEVDYRHATAVNLTATNMYTGGGVGICFREETVCTHFEGHIDGNANFTYAGSLMIRK